MHALAVAMKPMSFSGEERQFVEAVLRYFPEGTLSGFTTDSQELLDWLEYFRDSPSISTPNYRAPGPLDIRGKVIFLIGEHRQCWSLVCESYARLKTSVIGRG